MCAITIIVIIILQLDFHQVVKRKQKRIQVMLLFPLPTEQRKNSADFEGLDSVRLLEMTSKCFISGGPVPPW
jgi:hypothetical protein